MQITFRLRYVVGQNVFSRRTTFSTVYALPTYTPRTYTPRIPKTYTLKHGNPPRIFGLHLRFAEHVIVSKGEHSPLSPSGACQHTTDGGLGREVGHPDSPKGIRFGSGQLGLIFLG